MEPTWHEVPDQTPCDTSKKRQRFLVIWGSKGWVGGGAAEGGTWGHGIHAIGFR
jgi:hypothetical protein